MKTLFKILVMIVLLSNSSDAKLQGLDSSSSGNTLKELSVQLEPRRMLLEELFNYPKLQEDQPYQTQPTSTNSVKNHPTTTSNMDYQSQQWENEQKQFHNANKRTQERNKDDTVYYNTRKRSQEKDKQRKHHHNAHKQSPKRDHQPKHHSSAQKQSKKKNETKHHPNSHKQFDKSDNKPNHYFDVLDQSQERNEKPKHYLNTHDQSQERNEKPKHYLNTHDQSQEINDEAKHFSNAHKQSQKQDNKPKHFNKGNTRITTPKDAKIPPLKSLQANSKVTIPENEYIHPLKFYDVRDQPNTLQEEEIDQIRSKEKEIAKKKPQEDKGEPMSTTKLKKPKPELSRDVVAEPPLEFCNLQKKQGSCFTREPRFFYEINNGDCLMFMYTGCNGNQNNFLTQEECLLTCHPTTSLLRDSLPG